MDTNQLYKNLHKINPYDLISISYKIHGTSGISSKILTNKELKWYDKLLIKLGVSIETTKYSLISASRTVIKSETSDGGFYGEDIWKIASNYLKDHITNGMTLYYEICGFTPSGKHIQKGYDYGCIKPTNNQYIEGYNYKIYIYRITLTNVDGKVFEFSSKQVQDWCYSKGLKPVPELYYGFANDVLPNNKYELSEWHNYFLNYIKNKYNDKKCFMCKNIVPEEGVVIRIENLEFNAFKCKSEDFYLRETKQLDWWNWYRNNKLNIMNKPFLTEVIFKFQQDCNTNGSTDPDGEELEITLESVNSSLDKIGGFYTIRTTTGWSINDLDDMKSIFEQIKNIVY